MIKRLLEISRHSAHLSLRNSQLVVASQDDGERREHTFPIEDLGMVCIDQPQTTYTHQALTKLLENGVGVIVCGQNHLPAGMLLPFSHHAEVASRLHSQLALTESRRKQLWQQIVRAKIQAQARNIENPKIRSHLLGLARRVRSGDAANAEAQAARHYWRAWLVTERAFRRNPAGNDSVNSLLNYGYAILRAAVARALVSGGFLPALGLHHRNRANPFSLADDLMEPLRPLADARVQTLISLGVESVSPAAKAALLDLLSMTVELEGDKGPLMVALHRTVGSLTRCLEDRQAQLLLPIGIGEESQLKKDIARLLDLKSPEGLGADNIRDPYA